MGDDGISLDMLLLTLPHSLGTITAIINKSIMSSVFPDAWKVALVTPLPKKSHVSSFKDLRPISILPCISKIIERLVYTQLSAFLEKNQVLPVLQSGFRKTRSTATALLDVVDNILSAQDMGMGTIMALLDFSRAFDAINTKLLLSKMKYYGFEPDTIKWFSSYLNDRMQVVKLQDSSGMFLKSKPSILSRGVPQGSILGPLLFILYTADVRNVIKHSNFHLYADDIQIYIPCNPTNVTEVVAKINEDLNNITTWSSSNSLVLNPSKSKVMIFGSKHQLKQINSYKPKMFISGEEIDRVFESRNLGVIMDESLRFESHIADIARNSFYRLKILYRIRDFLSEDLRIKLCDTLILSRFDYADVVYGPRLLARTDRIIQRVQNACAGYCLEFPLERM